MSFAMNRVIQLHVDGSSKKFIDTTRRAHWVLGWGVCAGHDGIDAEVLGARIGRTKEQSGWHEYVALAEGVLYATAKGFAPHQVVIHTDCDLLANAGFVLHPGNGVGKAAETLTGTFERLCSTFYDGQTLELVLQVLRQARLNKVASHRRVVYNERADFLAKHAVALHATPAEAAPLSFSGWLAKGLTKWVSPEEQVTWYAPFAPTAPECT
ncbi:hypothetical protein D3C71_20540 [compost metagenome]